MELCEHAFLKRAVREYQTAAGPVRRAKLEAMRLLQRYGFHDVYKENLTADGQQFRSEEDRRRFRCAP